MLGPPGGHSWSEWALQKKMKQGGYGQEKMWLSALEMAGEPLPCHLINPAQQPLFPTAWVQGVSQEVGSERGTGEQGICQDVLEGRRTAGWKEAGPTKCSAGPRSH